MWFGATVKRNSCQASRILMKSHRTRKLLVVSEHLRPRGCGEPLGPQRKQSDDEIILKGMLYGHVLVALDG